jgi:dTDP-4-dehydrorhamnose reductase
MKVLILGGSGQLGYELMPRLQALNFEVFAPVRRELDLTDSQTIDALVVKLKPDALINCAAYTAVDKAEGDKDLAFLVNGTGVQRVAEACKKVEAHMIHVSTDYVFDGALRRPYKETDTPNPLSVYGASKLAGEQAVISTLKDSGAVVRTAWLHGKKGPNFVHTMLRLFKERESLRVVSDHQGTPTHAGWLAEALMDLLKLRASGVFHATCSGSTTWFDFAKEILALTNQSDFVIKSIEPQLQRDAGGVAKRPQYSILNCDRLDSVIKRVRPTWQAGLRAHLSELGLVRS